MDVVRMILEDGWTAKALARRLDVTPFQARAWLSRRKPMPPEREKQWLGRHEGICHDGTIKPCYSRYQVRRNGDHFYIRATSEVKRSQ